MRDYFEWAKEGSCVKLGMDPNLFAKPRDDYEVLEAKRVCRLRCPVRSDCLAHAIIYGEAGVWGGFSEAERDEMAKDIRAKLAELARRAGVFHVEMMRKPLESPTDESSEAA